MRCELDGDDGAGSGEERLFEGETKLCSIARDKLIVCIIEALLAVDLQRMKFDLAASSRANAAKCASALAHEDGMLIAESVWVEVEEEMA